MKYTIVLIIFAVLILSVDARPAQKPDYAKAQQKAQSHTGLYAKYDTIEIHVHAMDNVTRQEWVSVFYPRVDEFTVLELVGTWKNESKNGGSNKTDTDVEADMDTSVNEFVGTNGTFAMVYNPNLTIWVSFPRHPNVNGTAGKLVYTTEARERDLSGRIVPYFSVLALLDEGNFTEFKWDDGCHECNDQDCLDNNCTVDRWHKNEDRCLKSNCNIQIYLAWMGRDKDDSACRSVSSLPSGFSKYSVQGIQNFGNGLFDDFIFGFQNNAPNPLDETA